MPSNINNENSPTIPQTEENRCRLSTIFKSLCSIFTRCVCFLFRGMYCVFRSIYSLICRVGSLFVSSHTQTSRSSEPKRQKPLEDQQARARHEASKILESVTSSPIGFVLPKTKWTENKRIPCLYYINKQQTILIILQGDITRTKVDAIVNAANEHMTGGGGVDGVIHDAAGNELYEACKRHKEISRGVRLPTGHSRILLSYDMSKTTYYIINTAGPRYSRYLAEQCREELRSCYESSLALAGLYDLESVGYTAISCGIFGYPVDEGAEVALKTVDEKAGCVPVVAFVLWDDHIYDAWKKTAIELKFTEIDPRSLIEEKSSSSTTTTTTAAAAAATDDDQNETEQTKLTTDSNRNADEINGLVIRLPSVPRDEPDTQNMDSQDTEENNFNAAKSVLTTQNTAEMNDADGEKENLTEKTNSSSDKLEEKSVATDTTTDNQDSK